MTLEGTTGCLVGMACTGGERPWPATRIPVCTWLVGLGSLRRPMTPALGIGRPWLGSRWSCGAAWGAATRVSSGSWAGVSKPRTRVRIVSLATMPGITHGLKAKVWCSHAGVEACACCNQFASMPFQNGSRFDTNTHKSAFAERYQKANRLVLVSDRSRRVCPLHCPVNTPAPDCLAAEHCTNPPFFYPAYCALIKAALSLVLGYALDSTLQPGVLPYNTGPPRPTQGALASSIPILPRAPAFGRHPAAAEGPEAPSCRARGAR